MAPLRPIGEFATLQDAAEAVESGRVPATAVVRVGDETLTASELVQAVAAATPRAGEEAAGATETVATTATATPSAGKETLTAGELGRAEAIVVPRAGAEDVSLANATRAVAYARPKAGVEAAGATESVSITAGATPQANPATAAATGTARTSAVGMPRADPEAATATGAGSVVATAQPRAANESVTAASTIPDSVEYQFVASSANDGGSWPDEDGQITLSAIGAPSVNSSVINGEPVVSYDGTDDAHDNTNVSMTQPNGIVVVYRLNSSPSFPRVIGRSQSSDQILSPDRSGSYGIWSGNWLEGGSNDTTDFHIVNALYDGSNSDFRVDGSQQASANAGSNDLAGIRVATNRVQDNFTGLEVAEMWFVNSPSTSDRDDADQYLSDKYGIALS